MAYDEATYRRADEAPGPAAYRSSTLAAADHRRRADELADPADGWSDGGGRDRLAIHLGWEMLLLIAAGVFAFLLYRLDPDNLQRPALDKLLITGAAIGLLALGAGLTLRAAVPNLALGPIAVAASLHYAEQGDQGLVRAAAPALIVAAAGALLIGLLILVLHVPAWVATLAGGLGVVVFNQLRLAPVNVQGQYHPTGQAFFLFGGFALLAVLGGALGMVSPVRRWLSRMRPVSDPAHRRGAGAAGPVLISLIVSSVFAVGAGILMSAGSAGPVVPSTGLEWTGIALGVALLAGTSAYGRRGGIFGTLFAVVALTLFLQWSGQRQLNISTFAIAGAMLAGGLLATRLVEAFGKPALQVSEEWAAAPVSSTGGTSGLEGWSAVPTPATPNRWDAGPWGTTSR